MWSGDTKTVTARAAAAPPPTRTEDRDAARGAVLEIDDMPAGWASNDAQPQTMAPRESLCPAWRRAQASRNARVASGAFAYGHGWARHYVFVYETRGLAEASYDGVARLSQRRCYARELRKQEAATWKDRTKATRTSTWIVQAPASGDETHGSRVRFWLERDGEAWSEDHDMTITRIGRALSFLTYYDVDYAARPPVLRAATAKVTDVFGDEPRPSTGLGLPRARDE